MNQPRRSPASNEPRPSQPEPHGDATEDVTTEAPFVGEGRDAARASEPPASDPRPSSGGGYDSQRTYGDPTYGTGAEARRDANIGRGVDPFGGRGEPEPGQREADDRPDYQADVSRDRWDEARGVDPARGQAPIPDTSDGGLAQRRVGKESPRVNASARPRTGAPSSPSSPSGAGKRVSSTPGEANKRR